MKGTYHSFSDEFSELELVWTSEAKLEHSWQRDFISWHDVSYCYNEVHYNMDVCG